MQWTEAEIIASGAASAWEAYENAPKRGYSQFENFVAGYFAATRLQDAYNNSRDLALVTRAVKMAIEEAAHAYCEQCRSGDEPMPYEYKNAKGFVHGVYHCRASRIRALDVAAIAERTVNGGAEKVR